MPSWSPDGQKIAWVRAGATTGAVWLMNADGSNPHPITGQLTYLQHPSWSPDGSRLAFDYDRDGDSFSDLGVVNANGSGLHAVPVPSLGPYQRLDLSIGGWSPEGERLLIGAVTYNLSNPPSIYNMYIGRVLVSGGSPTVLIFPEYDAMPDMRSLDLEPPHTTMTLLPAFSRARPTLIQWNGADAGVSGLASYDVQYRVGTTAAWTTWLTRTTDTSAMYTGIAGTTVTFRVRGRDVAGNTESWRTASGSDTSTTFYTWSLSGAVTDNRGMPIPAASLSLTPGAIRNVATDLSGDYLARLKASGNHTVVPGHTGYQAPPATSLSMDQDRDFSPYLLPNDNRVQNGGFEASSTTLTNWTHSGTLPAAVTTIDSHTGGRAALLGQPCAALCLSGAETVPADHSGYPPVPAGAVVDTLGTVHVLWTRIDQDIFPNAHVYYQSRSPDGTWSTATPIGVGESARLVLDSHQRLLAVWVTPDHRLIERQRPASGGAWSAPQDLGLANAAKLYTDHQGRAYVLYYCFSILGCPNTGEGLYRMRTAAGAWQVAHPTPTGDGSLAIGPEDTVHLVWHANNHGYAAVLLPGGSFSAPVQFGEEYQVYLPQAAIDSRGVVHVVWVLNGDTYYARQTPDGQWSSPVLLPKGGEPAQLVAGAGQVYLINTWTKAGDNNTYLRSISAAGLWSTPEKLLDGMHAV